MTSIIMTKSYLISPEMIFQSNTNVILLLESNIRDPVLLNLLISLQKSDKMHFIAFPQLVK